jgi:hypothetical protein
MTESWEGKGNLCYEAGKSATCMAYSECLPHTLIRVREGLRAGEVVGEGRVEEGGGVRGSEAPRRSTRGDQAAVCVHIDTQSSGFGSDEAHFALQSGVECHRK